MKNEESSKRVSLCQSANYCIKIQGKLVDFWEESYSDLNSDYDDKQDITTMIMKVRDQSELFGLLQRLNGMALPLVSVECIKAE